MKTRFYERSAYSLSDEPVPNCFIKLDDHFDTHLSVASDAPLHFCLVLAESICSRMADVEMFAFLIEDARKRHNLDPENVSRASDVKAAVLTRSFLIGYLGACRSLFDSAAATLATLYELPLTNSEHALGNRDFWHQLVVKEPNVHRRYHTLRLFFNEVLQWCNETPTRVPPLILLQHHLGQFARRESLLQIMDDRNTNLEQMAVESTVLPWIDALDLHRRWKIQLVTLCDRLCQDIAQNT